MSRHILAWLLPAATSLSLLLIAAAGAQQLEPALLPPLQVHYQPEESVDRPSVSWQIHQRLDHSFQTGQGRLSLMPSLTVLLHDPQAETASRLAAIEAQLNALQRTDERVRSALPLHADYLRLQQAQQRLDILQDWFANWEQLPAGGPGQAARSELHWHEAQALERDTLDHAELLALRLNAAGISFSRLPERHYRPRLSPGSEPLVTCLSGSPAVRRLELLQDLAGLGAEHARLAQQLRVELDMGAQVSLSSAAAAQPDASLGLNASLRISRADHSDPRLQLDLNQTGFAQSLTIRGPDTRTADPPAQDAYDRLAEAEPLRLLSLLLMLDQLARSESLARESARLELALISESAAGGTALRSELSEVLHRLLTLQQSELQHDQLLLEVAAECGLEPVYEEVSIWP